MDRCEQFALVAAREAWADAGQPIVSPERLGVSVTCGIGGIGSTLAAYVRYADLGPYVIPGHNTQNSVLATAGALLVGALAAAVAFALSVAGRYLTPLPLRHRSRVRTFSARPALT